MTYFLRPNNLLLDLPTPSRVSPGTPSTIPQTWNEFPQSLKV